MSTKCLFCGAPQNRHTYASHILSNHTDMLTAKELLGHANVSLTFDTYGHAELTKKREAASIIGGLLDAEIKPSGEVLSLAKEA